MCGGNAYLNLSAYNPSPALKPPLLAAIYAIILLVVK
jgi:hypothetical protein